MPGRTESQKFGGDAIMVRSIESGENRDFRKKTFHPGTTHLFMHKSLNL